MKPGRTLMNSFLVELLYFRSSGGRSRAPPNPPAPGPFGPLRGTRLALRRALYIEKLEKLEKIDFIINLSKSNFWGGSPYVDPPKSDDSGYDSLPPGAWNYGFRKCRISRNSFFHFLRMSLRKRKIVKKNPSSWSVFLENLYLGALGAIGMCRGGHVI